MKLTNTQKIGGIVGILTILAIIIALILFLKPKHASSTSDKCGWTYSDWSNCDSGTQTRTTTACKNTSGIVCADTTKCGTPILSQSCTSPDTCSWAYSDWGNCDSGTQTQTRTTTACKNTSGIVCADTTKCGTPILSQSCTSPDTCSWAYSDWSVCTDTTPNQTRTANCQNTSGTSCDISKCTGTKDDLIRQCVLSCCDKSSNPWTCNPAPSSNICSIGTPTYDCSSCVNTFPDNVYIFTQTDANSPIDMQNKINNVFNGQGGIGKHADKKDNPGQNSSNNYAFLFMPGTYTVDIKIGYYTHVAGLGKKSTDVTMNGGPIVENGSDDFQVGALNNFWRSCENMTVNPTKPNYLGNNSMTYAVSQACSLRSVNINGNLALAEMADTTSMGYSSGGFMANCKIFGILAMGSQQQFICRNTEYGTFPNTSWNHVNVGCKSTQGARKGCCIPTPTTPVNSTHNLTVVDNTPRVYEKPYLACVNPTNPTDRNSITQSIVVMCPSLLTNSSGTSNNINTNTQITSTNYRIVNENITGALLNQILANTDIHCIIFSPGRYNIETPIKLSNQLLFGLGLPVLTSTNDNSIVVGYGSMCGIIFDAGIGGNGKNILLNLNYNSPSYLWDIYCRVGGGSNNSDKYSIDIMLYIGGDNSILDNVWCWVADHYADDNSSVGWDKAICNIGLNVSGKDVIAYGLFSEHTRSRNVYWSGENGQVYMFQSEFNYYIPTVYDFVSYEIDPNVKTHKLYGAGAYSFFANKPDGGDLKVPMVSAGFKWGNTNVDYQNLVTVFLNGYGGISHVFNTTGIPVQYQLDDKGHPVGTQIAIACKDGGSCDCYPSCDTSISTCNKDLYRCKPNSTDACSVEIVKSLTCPTDSNWNCPGFGCFSEKQAQSDCPKTKCQMW